eukprot:755267-Hanusia_phi.AAC.1
MTTSLGELVQEDERLLTSSVPPPELSCFRLTISKTLLPAPRNRRHLHMLRRWAPEAAEVTSDDASCRIALFPVSTTRTGFAGKQGEEQAQDKRIEPFDSVAMPSG